MNRLLRLTLCVTIAWAASAQQPPFTLKFDREGLTVHGLKPGTKVAWMAMVRERVRHQTRVRILSGYGPVTPNSPFSAAFENADTSRGIWAVADVDGGKSVHAGSPVTVMSDRRIVADAKAGDQAVTIGSTAIEVLYVRPKFGAWRYAVADGGGRDADGATNGRIVMRLSDLRPFKGNPHPPAEAQQGDLVVMIDPRGMRAFSIEVGK